MTLDNPLLVQWVHVAATITNAYPAPRVPDFEGELHATLRRTIFPGEQPH